MANPYVELAKLRPGMPLSALAAIVGPDCQPSKSGSIRIDAAVAIRVDVDGLLGTIKFILPFPKRIPVEGLRLGMSLDDLMALKGRVVPVTNASGTLNAYEWPINAHSVLTANVLLPSRQSNNWADGTLHSIDISDPTAVYAQSDTFLSDATTVRIRDTANTDPSSMLNQWAENHAPFGATGDEELYARWLSEIATPVDWHAATLGWNCDHGFVPFFWIVRQPDCEKATALSLFDRFEPLRLLMQMCAQATWISKRSNCWNSSRRSGHGSSRDTTLGRRLRSMAWKLSGKSSGRRT